MKEKLQQIPGFTDVRADRQTDIGNVYPMGRDGHDEDYRAQVGEACEELLEDAFHTNVNELAAT